MKENRNPNEVPIIRLSTGYEVQMETQSVERLDESFDHLIRAIVGEHFVRGLSRDKVDKIWDAIAGEIQHLIDNYVSEPKVFLREVLLYQCRKTFHDLLREALPQFFKE